jgi:tape measure domain
MLNETIQLYDRMSASLMNATNAANVAFAAFDKFSASASMPIDTSSIDRVSDVFNKATQSINEFNDKAQNIISPALPPISGPPQQEMPVAWQSSDMEIFTNTGAERFEREISSASEMIERLRNSQSKVTQQALNMNILPGNAVNSLISVNDRIAVLKQKIEDIGNNPINIASENSNAELENLRGQLIEAVSAQEKLNIAMKSMDIGEINTAYLRLNGTISGVEQQIRDGTNEQMSFNKAVDSGANNTSNLASKVMGLVGKYAGMDEIKKLFNLSDSMTQIKVQLDSMNDGLQTTEQLNSMIQTSAQNSRSSYMDMANAVTAFGSQANGAFDNTQEIVSFAEEINKMFIVAGTDTQGAESVMNTLTQAMSSGVISGQELNTVLNDAGPIVQSIADYMGEPITKVQELAEQGQITSDIIKNSLFAASESTSTALEDIPITWSQIWDDISNRLLAASQPILEFISFLAQNWSYIEPIVLAIAVAVGVYTAAMAIKTATTWLAVTANTVLNSTLLANPIMVIVIAILVIVAVIYNWVQSIGGIKIAWAITMNVIKTTWDLIKLSLASGIAYILDKFDAFKLKIAEVAMGIANYMGDLKVDILMILESMVNGAIDIINTLITQVNTIPGISIDAVATVTFGTSASIKNIEEKARREAEFAEYKANIQRNMDERRQSIEDMALETQANLELRLGEIEKMKIEAERDSTASSPDVDTFDGGAMDELVNNTGDILNNTAGTANNTSAIADSLDATVEELQYIRDMAEQEVINRFTTAEIKVDMTNNNTIKNGSDLDGMVRYLTSSVNDAMHEVSERSMA